VLVEHDIAAWFRWPIAISVLVYGRVSPLALLRYRPNDEVKRATSASACVGQAWLIPTCSRIDGIGPVMASAQSAFGLSLRSSTANGFAMGRNGMGKTTPSADHGLDAARAGAIRYGAGNWRKLAVVQIAQLGIGLLPMAARSFRTDGAEISVAAATIVSNPLDP